MRGPRTAVHGRHTYETADKCTLRLRRRRNGLENKLDKSENISDDEQRVTKPQLDIWGKASKNISIYLLKKKKKPCIVERRCKQIGKVRIRKRHTCVFASKMNTRKQTRYRQTV